MSICFMTLPFMIDSVSTISLITRSATLSATFQRSFDPNKGQKRSILDKQKQIASTIKVRHCFFACRVFVSYSVFVFTRIACSAQHSRANSARPVTREAKWGTSTKGIETVKKKNRDGASFSWKWEIFKSAKCSRRRTQ